MALAAVFSGVVKTARQIRTDASASIRPAAAGRRWGDVDPIIDQADQRARKGLFQRWPALCFRQRAVQNRKQSFNLAKFRRSLTTEPIDRTQQQPKPDFPRHRCKSLGVEGTGIEGTGIEGTGIEGLGAKGLGVAP
jgi:hypothetical protein